MGGELGCFSAILIYLVRGWNRAEKLNILAKSSVTPGAEEQLTQMIRSLPLLHFYTGTVLTLGKF